MACACIWFLFTSYEHLSRTNERGFRASEWVINVHNKWIKTYAQTSHVIICLWYTIEFYSETICISFFFTCEKNDITNQIAHIIFFTAYRFYSLLPQWIKLYTYIIKYIFELMQEYKIWVQFYFYPMEHSPLKYGLTTLQQSTLSLV